MVQSTDRLQNSSYSSSLNHFIGCNMFELAYLDTAISAAMLKDAAEQGFTVVRFWAFQPLREGKLEELCEKARELKLKLIPVLADKWGYLQEYKIRGNWYKSDYRTKYLPYVSGTLRAMKDCDEILIWELINEPEADSFGVFYDFIRAASAEAKATGTKQMISLGTVGGIGDKFGGPFSRLKVKNFRKIYELPTLDAVSIHDYSFDAALLERADMYYRLHGKPDVARMFGMLHEMIDYLPSHFDRLFIRNFGGIPYLPLTLRWLWHLYNKKNIAIAKELGKPLYAGELGYKKGGIVNRLEVMKVDVRQKFRDGVWGVLLWSFQAQGWSNDGHDYGFGTEDGFGELQRS